MPRYLRWIAACTAGVTAQFAFFMLVGALAVGTDNKELSGGIGLIASFGSAMITMLATLAVNDWLAGRYPLPSRARPPAESTREPIEH